MSVVKRKRDTEPEQKKPKAAFGEKERELLNNQNEEWPMYNHPDGGTVKFTPWGSLRQWTDPSTGQSQTWFVDASFQDASFEMSPDNVNNQCYELPSTPMSLTPSISGQSSPSRGGAFIFTPSNEAESYVVEGYGQLNKGYSPFQTVAHEYAQEQENYLGMAESEDFSDDMAMS